MSRLLLLTAILVATSDVFQSYMIKQCTNLEVYGPENFYSNIKQRSIISYLKSDKLIKPASLDVSLYIPNKGYCNVSKPIKETDFKDDDSLYMEIDHGFPIDVNEVGYVRYALLSDEGKLIEDHISSIKGISEVKDLVILETDKPFYTPGDTLKARVLIFNSNSLFELDSYKNAKCTAIDEVNFNLQASETSEARKNENISVIIERNDGQIIADWTNISIMEALNLEYKIFENSYFGSWKFKVFYRGKQYQKELEYSRFGLTRYSMHTVIVKKPELFSESYPDNSTQNLEVTACAKEPSGVIVSSDVTVKACISGTRNSREITCMTSTKAIKGLCGSFNFNINDWRQNGFLIGKIRVTAEARENSGVDLRGDSKSTELDYKLEDYFTIRGVYKNLPSRVVISEEIAKIPDIYFAVYSDSADKITHIYKFDKYSNVINIPPITKAYKYAILRRKSNGEFIQLKEKGFYENPEDLLISGNKTVYVNSNTCQQSHELEVIFNKKLAGKNLYLISQSNGRIVHQKFLLKEEPCNNRNDTIGHFTCNADGGISCHDGYYGINCLQKKCKCKEGCLCGEKEECICDPSFESRSTDAEKNERQIVTQKVQIKITEDFGSEFSGLLYYLDEFMSVSKTNFEVKNLTSCTNKVISRNRKSKSIPYNGFYLSKDEIAPGENVTLNIQYEAQNNEINKDKLSSFCFVHAYDASLENLDNANKNLAMNMNTYAELVKAAFKISREERNADIMANMVRRSRCKFSNIEQSTLIGTLLRPESLIIRNNFPVNWIFKAVSVKSINPSKSIKGVSMMLKAPDSITKWKIAAYCPTDSEGIWMPEKEIELSVKQTFHVETNLPQQVVRDEILEFPTYVVFEDTSLKNFSSLITINVKVDSNDWEVPSGYIQQFCLNKNYTSFEERQFKLKPKSLGNLSVTVSAKAQINHVLCTGYESPEDNLETFTDVIQKTVFIKPNGTPKKESVTTLVCLKNEKTKFEKVSIKIPASNIVPNSMRVTTRVSGQSMAITSENLNKLIERPVDCGEQNLLNMRSSISILKYLKSTMPAKERREQEFLKSVKSKATKYVLEGYRRELRYRKMDGSFSAFGRANDIGSTWLTALVIKTFGKASKVLGSSWKVNATNVVTQAISYLTSVTDDSECFLEYGASFDASIREKDSKNIRFVIQIIDSLCTVHCSPLYETDAKMKEHLKNMILNGKKCLDNVLDIEEIKKPSSQLDLAEYINLVRKLIMIIPGLREEFKELSTVLEEHSNFNEEKDLKWWGEDTQDNQYKLKATSTAVLALNKGYSEEKKFPIVKWILSKQNANGGFYSTLDTAMAIEALSNFIMPSFEKNTVLTVKVSSKELEGNVKSVLSKNKIFTYNLWDIKLNEAPKAEELDFIQKISTDKKETGCLQFSVSVSYNVKPYIEETNDLDISLKIDQKKDDSYNCRHFLMTACVNRNNPDFMRGMILMTVDLPTGFSVTRLSPITRTGDDGSLPKLIRLNQDRSKAYAYFSPFTDAANSEEVKCYVIGVDQNSYVEGTSPAKVTVEDYYSMNTVYSDIIIFDDCRLHWLLTDITPRDGKKVEVGEKVCHSRYDLIPQKMQYIKSKICNSGGKHQVLKESSDKADIFPDSNVAELCDCIEPYPAVIYQQSDVDRIEKFCDINNMSEFISLLEAKC